jgi:hypothetical protein
MGSCVGIVKGGESNTVITELPKGLVSQNCSASNFHENTSPGLLIDALKPKSKMPRHFSCGPLLADLNHGCNRSWIVLTLHITYIRLIAFFKECGITSKVWYGPDLGAGGVSKMSGMITCKYAHLLV